jgi:hypothetical protein
MMDEEIGMEEEEEDVEMDDAVDEDGELPEDAAVALEGVGTTVARVAADETVVAAAEAVEETGA